MKRLRIAALVGLLLVPTLLHGHRHDALRSTAAPCAVCIAAHHSPAAVPPAIGPLNAIVVVAAPPAIPPVAAVHPQRSPRAGRAPPAPAPVSVA